MESIAGYWVNWQLIIIQNLLNSRAPINTIISNPVTISYTTGKCLLCSISYNWGNNNCYVCHRLWTYNWNLTKCSYVSLWFMASYLLPLKILYLDIYWGVSWSEGEGCHCILLTIIIFGHSWSIYRSYMSFTFYG